MRVVGTAGHVDHGKSSLVKRLTGIDPDRLAEEKNRQMTIDLGFAWLALPQGETIGIVDVPGHRDFIENMLAGVGGIDAALFIVAADEGVMPQTREHLAILDLLGVSHAVVVLSKIDLVDDPDWLTLVELEVHELLQNTSLSAAPVVRVSARDGRGLDDLLVTLEQVLASAPPRPNAHQARLPIDRVFSMSGFGTIVTGTLSGGALRVSDEMEIQPGGMRTRVRGLQAYKQSVEQVQPGTRVAVNITGLETREIARGNVLARPGLLHPTLLIDAQFRHIAAASRPLLHNTEIKFFSGTSEALARIRLLDAEALAPGLSGWVQIALSHPLALAARDHFIVRLPSPAETIGGGLVVNPHPGRRWRRFRAEVIEGLNKRLQGSPAERIAHAADQPEPLRAAELHRLSGYDAVEFDAGLSEAIANQTLVLLRDGTYWSSSRAEDALERIRAELRLYHTQEPLRAGMSREMLRSRLKFSGPVMAALLALLDDVLIERDLLRLSNHAIRFTPQQQRAADALLQQMNTTPYAPPSLEEAFEMASEPVVRALIERGDLVLLQTNLIFLNTAYEELVAGTLAMIAANGSIDAKGLRDQYGSSRKYAIGLLEHLDALGITRRNGDVRVRGPKAP